MGLGTRLPAFWTQVLTLVELAAPATPRRATAAQEDWANRSTLNDAGMPNEFEDVFSA